MREIIRAHGHEHVRAEYASIFGVTTDDWPTSVGDYIIGIEAERTPTDFDPALIEACQSRDAAIDVYVRVNVGDETHEQAAHAREHPDLTSEGDRSVVSRTSDYVGDRTGAADAVHITADSGHDLVSALVNRAELAVIIEVE